MPLQNLALNMGFGELSAAIASGTATIPLAAGEGARFDVPVVGSWLYGKVTDQSVQAYARFSFFRYTGVSGDTLTGVTWGYFGTAAQAFPIAGGQVSNCRVEVADAVRTLREFIQGQGAIIQAGAPVLTGDSPELVSLTPAAPIIVTLPATVGSDVIWLGKRFKFQNKGAFANTITVNASDGTTVLILPGGFNAELIAYQDSPTTNTHWGPPSSYLKSVQLDQITAGGTAVVGGAAAATPAAGKALFGALATDGFGVAKSAFYTLNEAGTRWEQGGGAAARNIAAVGVDLASYSSGTGTAGTDATAQTVKSITLKGNSLNAPGRGVRIRVSFTSTTATPITATLTINGVTVTISGNTVYGGTGGFIQVDAWYVDSTHLNVQMFQMAATTGSVVAQFFTNQAGYTNTVDQVVALLQNNIAASHITVFLMAIEQLG